MGVQLKAGTVLGSFDTRGHYVPSPAGAAELDYEQDVFAALRVLDRGQIALLVPLVETWRKTPGLSELGGGVGDVNLGVRYDLTLAGASRSIPGIAALAGLTLPTGRPPDDPDAGALATRATGIGAYQFNVGVAFEQAFGPWLVNATGVVAQRTARTVMAGSSTIHERLGPQWTALAALAYTFPSEVAVALSASYVIEQDATIQGVDAGGTAHRLATVTLSGVLPLSDVWRVQGALFDNPPVSQVGLNQPVNAGLSITVVRSWI